MKYPHILVRLTGEGTNPRDLLQKVVWALQQHGVRPHIVKRFITEATRSDMGHLLETIMNWVDIE